VASLDPAKRKLWNSALAAVTAPWVVCGITRRPDGEYASLDGFPGLIDWQVHGQVSRLLKRGRLAAGEACLVAGDPARGLPSYLLFPVEESAAALAQKLRALRVEELALAESTFPEDFLHKVKQTFKKEGIRSTPLEPQS
jgi:hypothetical protein